jgi:hypothetical protein
MPDTLPNAPRKMVRLTKAGWIIKALATIFVIAFLCAYLHTWMRYGAPRTQASVAPTHLITVSRMQAPRPIHSHIFHRRQVFFRPVHQVNRHARRSNPYYLASLRHLRRLFSEMLDVRS